MVKFSSEILSVGALADEFREDNILIFFGDRANGGLEDYSVIIHEPDNNTVICVGDTVRIGDRSYTVTAVGSKVEDTFSTIGHFTARFDAAEVPALPGTVHLSGDYPVFSIGDQLVIEE